MRTYFNYRDLLLLFIAGLFMLLINQCKNEVQPPVDMYYEYFPTKIGHYVVYDVDSIVYDDFTGTIDTFYYQVKEVIESEFVDADNNKSLRLERFIRDSVNGEWRIKNVWKARLDETKALKTEENVSYIKLVFPPDNNKTWDGNAYNSRENQTYIYVDVHNSYSFNGLTFDSTLTVLQKDFITLISEDFQMEVYAKNTGMVYRKFIALVKEVDGTIVRGVDYSYSFFEMGEIQ